jgi:hypothetical protein
MDHQRINNVVDRTEMLTRVRQLSEEIREKVRQLREMVQALSPESVPVIAKPRIGRLSSTYDYPPPSVKL